jgi:hypothetical protein
VIWFLLVVVLAVAAVIGYLTLGRHGESPVPAGHWEPTEEVFRDPSSGRRMRVWIDPGDASRHYVPEPD